MRVVTNPKLLQAAFFEHAETWFTRYSISVHTAKNQFYCILGCESLKTPNVKDVTWIWVFQGVFTEHSELSLEEVKPLVHVSGGTFVCSVAPLRTAQWFGIKRCRVVQSFRHVFCLKNLALSGQYNQALIVKVDGLVFVAHPAEIHYSSETDESGKV